MKPFQLKSKLSRWTVLAATGLMFTTSAMAGETNSNAFSADLISKEVSPCEDFDQFVNGKWKTLNPVPATESRWGSFNILREDNQKRGQQIIDDLLKGNFEKGSTSQQVADLYRSLTNREAVNQRGLLPVQAYFGLIDRSRNVDDLFKVFAAVPGTSLPFGVYVSPDLKNVNKNALYMVQSGLSLADRDFYLSDNENHVRIRTEYVKHLERMHKLLGMKEKEAQTAAKHIFNIEKAIAQLHIPKEDQRDPNKIYNKVSMEQLRKMSPYINWDVLFQSLGIQTDELILENVNYVFQLNNLFNQFDIEQWKTYMKWHLTKNMSAYLPEAIENESFAFFGTFVNGVAKQKTTEEKAIRSINSLMGQPFGKLYVERFFSPESKAKVENMIENMRAAYADRINGLDWMSDATKQQALVKLKSFTYKIGYPEKWLDYSSVSISPDKLLENVIRLQTFEQKRNFEKLHKPVDKTEWFMNPHEVNAYYNPLNNEIVFPAGILQAPFFDPNADDALNYGAIGAVIGHEFTHGFDDQGAKFDEEGNLSDWWTAEDLSKFQELTGRLANQYDQFEILPGVNINGKFTLGENIADQGGVLLAYYALLKSLEGKPAPALIDGYDQKQRFFFGWAQTWKNNSTEASLRQLIVVDPHSPARARVNVTLSNLQEFYDAFNCGEGSMYRSPDQRVTIW